MFCIQCGKKNLDGARYCFACGTLVAAAVEPAARSAAATSGGEAAAARVSASPTQASLAGKRCLSCGLFNPASAERCDCGFNFISGAVATLAGTRYAGFWIRVAASVLDGFVIGGLSVLGALVFGVAGMATEAAAEFAAAGYYIVSILASWLYYAICESSARQATLGKRAVGIIVTDLSGRPLSFGRASGRAFAKWLNALTLGIAGSWPHFLSRNADFTISSPAR